MATKIYDNVCFPGELALQGEELATSRQLISRSANSFLRLHFKRGDLIEIKEGVCMLDRGFNAMKPGYHLEDPERAQQLAGV